MRTLIKSIFGGICISIGCMVNLSCDNKYVGAILFATGLYAICVCDFNLFTGKACYKINNKRLWVIWLGNLIGSMFVSWCAILVKSDLLYERCELICANKLSESWYAIIILGVLCNFLIYFAVEGYKNKQPLLLIFSVATFILCGFEHCVANMFYLLVGSNSIGVTLCFLVLNTLGNLIGGLIIQQYRHKYS